MVYYGGINNPWQVNISVNSVADAPYAKYVSALCKKLFGIEPAMRKRKERNVLVILLSSTSVVDFLVSHGLARGNKLKNGLRIPEWILKKSSYRRACVRGLVDTDGCMYIHVHRIGGKEYKNIGLTFTSACPEFIFQVADILEESGIMPHIPKRGRDIYVYREKSVAEYLKIFGTSNSRIRSVYEEWRGAGAV